MDRKKFFISIGAGFLGAALIKVFPSVNVLAGKKAETKIKITPNPLAVSRKKIGDKNV